MGQWIQQQSLQPGWRALPSALIDGFPELRLFKSADALDPEEQINLALKASFVLRIRSEAYSGRINQVVEEIEREMTRDLSIFLPILQRYCSDITEMDIRPTFDFSNGFKTSKLMLKKASGALVDLSKEGQGKGGRRITLAVYEWNEKLIATENEIHSFEQLIVAFDEPDTHLDYTQQRKIFDIIKRIAAQDNTNVIVCTHSLNLIDRIPITDIVHFQLEDNFTKISTIATDDPELTDIFLYQISETMGLRNSALLNERCFIIVEGPTELYALPVLFKLKFGYPPQAAGVRILFGEGGIGARLFAKFLNDIHRNVIFLVDQDTTLSPHQRYFTRETLEEDGIDLDTQVHFVGTREFEDAFPNEIYMRAAQTFWPKADGTQWQISDFQQFRSGSDFSDDLMAMIRRNTRTNISKPQVGLHIAKSIRNLEEIPPPILRCLEHAGELAVTE